MIELWKQPNLCMNLMSERVIMIMVTMLAILKSGFFKDILELY